MPIFRPDRLVTLLLLVGAGCQSISVDSDTDPAVDFTTLRTFDWLPPNPKASTMVSDEVLLRLIGNELEAKGLMRNTSQPDVLISVHRTVEGTLNTKSSGYEFDDGRLRRYNLQEGTLVVDLITAAPRKVAWRGTATGAFRAYTLPEERQTLLTEILHEMFTLFPANK